MQSRYGWRHVRSACAWLLLVFGIPAPAQLLTVADFVQPEVSAEHLRRPEGRQPITVHLRLAGNGWTLIGVQRLR